MPFTKGGKPGPGKPKGSKHKKTMEWESLGSYVCKDGINRYMKVLKRLPDKEYLDHFEHVLEYFKPRLARIAQARDEKIPPATISAERKAEIEKALADL